MHGYVLLDKALDPYGQAEQHFMKTLSHDLETSLLPPSHLAKFLKITLGHAYLQSLAAQDGSSVLADALHTLVHDLVFRVLKAVSDGVLGHDQSLLVIKMYLRFLAASGSTVPSQTAGPLIALLQATSSKNVPNSFLLREDVELLGFASFNPKNPRDSLETLVESAAEEKKIRGGQVLALAVQLSIARPGLFVVTKKTAVDGPGNLVFKAAMANRTSNHASDVHPATATMLNDMEEEEGDEIVVYTGRKEAETPQPTRGGGLASAAITASSSFWTSSFAQGQQARPSRATHSSSSMIMGSKQDDIMEAASDGVNTISFLGLNQQSPSVPGGRIARIDPRTTYSMPPFMHFGGNPS
jgi:hypothetical protein